MTLTRGFIRNAVTTPLDARLMDMARVVQNTDGSPRVGVLGVVTGALLTALATMNVSIAAAPFVTSKGKADGVAIFTNDGTVNVPITAAPASNSRIDVIWVRHQDNTTGDGASTPIFGVTAGAAAASPTKPAIPTGALELGTLRVYAGTTAANGGSNTLTETYQMTAMQGGVVPFRNTTERDAWTTAPNGTYGFMLDSGAEVMRRGGAWVPTPRIVTGNFLLPVQGVGVNQTVPIVFPAGVFTSPPNVHITPSNGRVTASIVAGSVTVSGATLGFDNWSSGPVGSPHTVYWTAFGN